MQLGRLARQAPDRAQAAKSGRRAENRSGSALASAGNVRRRRRHAWKMPAGGGLDLIR